jgi:hypothetical protein
METQEQETETLKNIIDNVFSINIMKNSRTRNIVDARLIYAKILRDRGHTFSAIGRSLKKDHTTILYYISQIDHLIKHDVSLAEKYIMCKNIFLKDKPFISDKLKETDLIVKIEKLTKENETLILERKNVSDMIDSFRRIESIMKIVERQTRNGDEKLIEKKIIKMFNGLYQQE